MNFQIETHNFCNFSCGYCPHKDMERKKQFMDDEVWRAILHKFVVPYRHVNADKCPPTVILHKDSETLIDRKLPDRLRDIAAVAPDVKIDIYSNGVLLPVLAAQGRDFMVFLRTLPNRVRYLMSYHPRNHDNSPNDYGATIEYMRDMLRDPPPNVEFITVSHKSKWVSEVMQEAWARAWEGLPITVHKNAAINPWTGRIEEGTVRFSGCPYADFGHWFFGVTGNVIACCLDLEEEVVIGNVMTDDPQRLFEETDYFYAQQRQTARVNGLMPVHHVCYDCFGHERPKAGDLLQLGMRR